jgi:hypothetical protein
MAVHYSLQIRRNTDAYRTTITLLPGELFYCTDTNLVYVGNGTQVGGLPVSPAPPSGGLTLLRGTFLIPYSVASFSVPIVAPSIPSQVLITIRRPLGAPIITGDVADTVSSTAFTVELSAMTDSVNRYKCDWQAIL